MILVAINNFNYERFVIEAVDSAFNQSTPPDRILVVDDGSNDKSVELLRERYGEKIELIAKSNGGQLSCFNEVATRIDAKDLVFFLDADDRFLPNHIERCLSIYDSNPDGDFVFTRHRMFGTVTGPGAILCKKKGDLGYSVFPTREREVWLGGPTSTLSMKGAILKRFLPCPLEADWKVRADDILVMGASMAGARKYFLDEMTVEYRVHQSNHYCNRDDGLAHGYRYTLAKRRMLEWARQHFGMPYQNEPQLLALEYKLYSQKSVGDFLCYLGIMAAIDGNVASKILGIGSLCKSSLIGS